MRPLLVRPLMQAFTVTVPAAETEVNRIGPPRCSSPSSGAGRQYPFDPASKIEAAPAEIAKLFGPEGAVAKFANET